MATRIASGACSPFYLSSGDLIVTRARSSAGLPRPGVQCLSQAHFSANRSRRRASRNRVTGARTPGPPFATGFVAPVTSFPGWIIWDGTCTGYWKFTSSIARGHLAGSTNGSCRAGDNRHRPDCNSRRPESRRLLGTLCRVAFAIGVSAGACELSPLHDEIFVANRPAFEPAFENFARARGVARLCRQ